MSNSNFIGKKSATSRRTFVKSVGGAAAISLTGISPVDSQAEQLPRLDESDHAAVALNYVHDASSVADSLRTQKDHYCYNCALYAGSNDDEWAGCSIFPGRSVAGRGWCSVWSPKQPS
jgi:hypothetical protein